MWGIDGADGLRGKGCRWPAGLGCMVTWVLPLSDVGDLPSPVSVKRPQVWKGRLGWVCGEAGRASVWAGLAILCVGRARE